MYPCCRQVAPWSKTGGLGDVLGSLPIALAARGHRVMVVTPRYANYAEPTYSGVSSVCSRETGSNACQSYLKEMKLHTVHAPLHCIPECPTAKCLAVTALR